MDFHFFCTDNTPSTLGLHGAHGRMGARHAPPETVTVRDLIETVGRGNRTDLDGEKERREVRHGDSLCIQGIPLLYRLLERVSPGPLSYGFPPAWPDVQIKRRLCCSSRTVLVLKRLART